MNLNLQRNHAEATESRDKQLGQFITYVKISTAMAILRNKPTGMTGEQFAEQLCSSYKQGQLQLKERLKAAEAETERLKHQLVRLSSESQQEILSDVSDDISSSFSHHQRSSGESSFQEPRVQKHLEYFNSIDQLRSISSDKVTFTRATTKSKGGPQETVVKCITHIRKWMTQECLWTVLRNQERLQGVQGLVHLLHNCPKNLQHLVVEEVKKLVKELIGAIVLRQNPDKMIQTHLCQLLLSLCCHSDIVKYLAEQLLVCAVELTRSIKNIDTCFLRTSVEISNSYYVFNLIEKMLLGQPSIVKLYMSKAELEAVQELLQRCVSGLVGPCSTMAHYLYHLIGLVEKAVETFGDTSNS